MKISVRNNQQALPIRPAKIRHIAGKVLEHFHLGKEICLNILFVDDVKMAELHKRYLGKEEPTDVLAFSMQEGKTLKGDPCLLGDIAISTEVALRQAKRFHSNVNRELTLYVIHGILHLLGYEDQKKPARLKMRQKERELLKQCQNGV